MTDQKHTKEPWRILQKNSYFLILSGPDDDPINILPSMSNCYLDKASRAIECVNACAGIENPKDFIANLTEITKQRDKFRLALEDLVIEFKDQSRCSSYKRAEKLLIKTRE